MIFKRVIPFMIMCPLCLAGEEKFNEYKKRIDHLENSMIQEFSIDLPSKNESKFSESYSKAATQLEVKFEIQKKLFYKIEESLFYLNNDLDKELAASNLSHNETERLKTSIEYATRIILPSRKAEIHEMYTDLKKSLSHKPELNEIYSKLSEMDFKNCSLENIQINEQYSSLTFDIKKRDKFGVWSKSNFVITGNDINSGRVVSKPTASASVFPYQTFITQFWSGSQDETKQNFTLHLNPNGEVTQAEFHQEYDEPAFEIMGFKIGSKSIRKAFGCNKMRAPASTSEND